MTSFVIWFQLVYGTIPVVCGGLSPYQFFFLKLVIWSEASRHQSATDPFDRILVSQSSPKSTQINTIQLNLQQ